MTKKQRKRSGIRRSEGNVLPFAVYLEGDLLGWRATKGEAEALLIRACVSRLDLRGDLTPMLAAMAKGATAA